MDHISWEIYLKVLKKVMLQRKAVFRDLIKSGTGYKLAVWLLLNRMYKTEVFWHGHSSLKSGRRKGVRLC